MFMTTIITPQLRFEDDGGWWALGGTSRVVFATFASAAVVVMAVVVAGVDGVDGLQDSGGGGSVGARGHVGGGCLWH